MIRYAYIIPLLPLVSFFINIAVGKRLPRKGDWLSLATILAGLVMSIGIFLEVFAAYDPNFKYHVVTPWLTVGDRFTLNVGILVDNLTAVMLLVVSGVSTLVHLFSIGYMHGDPRYSRYFAYLSIFSFSMLGLVLSESFFFIFIFWELVGLSSDLLIGFWFEKKSAADAGKKAFITTHIGDVGFLIGNMIIFVTCGVFGYDEVFQAIGQGKLSGTLLTIAGIGVFCGAIGKSAQFPLHVWLPDAMEGPTPVSALIHAATMVAAGVYLVGRVYPMFTPDAFLFIAYIGFITLFIAATIALTQNDIKKVLAYSTVSQLGYMIMGLGVGGYTAGLAHLATHAAFKACLFLGSGSVIHALHTQDMREMGGLRKKMPITFVTFLIATLAISGVPGFSGFFSKDMILAAALEFGMKNPAHYVLFFGALFTAGMTAFYMFRLVIMTFLGEPKDHHKFDHAHESPPNMWVPLVVLAIFSFSFWFKSPFVEKGWFQTLITKPATVANLVAHEPAGAAPAGHAAAIAPAPHGIAPAEGGEHDAHLAHMAHSYAMYSSVAVGTLGIFLGFVVYFFGWIDPARVANSVKPLYNFLLNKWYFDELYDKTVIGGSIALAKFLAWFDLHVVDGLVNLAAQLGVFVSFLVGKFDNYVVDGAVNGLASATIGGGSILRRMQTGKLYHYVFVLAGGALVIFLIKAF
ncbi:NADH-quinone oxidoreductase subunit L [Candidatus Deferrimicrobium sp.]|uniref:NADH-quinone oxidoreductase subunit L n=1 Tax=Candidatus Deferrimicrobium sp. TaxID=3060586 RepID=UPI00271A0F85|nr:NADH-quinone oxidoreductase subunit L [Candidatus Deferrimicrobium sp.]MDO8739004.1 NADH-quinone oxidoreductase subunit L [Candidatus Deferrimicrobium sp.]